MALSPLTMACMVMIGACSLWGQLGVVDIIVSRPDRETMKKTKNVADAGPSRAKLA